MTRLCGALLLLACCALGDEDADRAVALRVRAEVAAGRSAEALALAEEAVRERPDSGLLELLRAEARRGVAREIQREAGHLAAAAYLEEDLTHPLLAVAYAETCAWAGIEERGIARLRASPLPVPLRVRPELDLLVYLGRYREAALRAAEVDWPAWESWAGEQADLRDRLDGRARRGVWAALVAGALLLAGAVLLFRLAPPRASSGSRS